MIKGFINKVTFELDLKGQIIIVIEEECCRAGENRHKDKTEC